MKKRRPEFLLDSLAAGHKKRDLQGRVFYACRICLADIVQACFHALTKASAFCPTCCTVMPGLYSAEPRPKADAPAAMNSFRLAGVMRPTGTSITLAGITARQALTTAGPSCSAGNILRMSAPAARAANASVTVATPGALARPAAVAARITSGSLCGMTI